MNNSGLDINILEAYLKGTLDPKSMHRVEKEALEDPFVAEALEGLSQSAAYAQNLSLLQRQLHERVAEHKAVKKSNVITWQRLSIAAAAAVVFISVGIMFLMRENKSVKQSTAGNINKEVEVSLSPMEGDSVPVVAVITSAEKQAVEAKVVAAAPVKEAAVPEKANQEIDIAVSDVASSALAKNTVKPAPQNEEIILGSSSARKEQAVGETAVTATALRSRVSEISVPQVLGKAVSPKDGVTPVPDPVVRPALGNRPETLAYAQDVKTASIHSLTAALRSNGGVLNEVVVPGYNRFLPARSVPVPSVDHTAYTRYLNKNNKLYTGANEDEFVELSFTVSKAGKPEQIKVTKGLEQEQNDEAIRLLKDGPKWIVPKKGSNKATLKVYF